MRWTTDIRCWGVVSLALSLLALSGCSGGGGGGASAGGATGNGTGAQVVTGLGVPSGSATTASVDTTGGVVSDGAASFALTIPAGALPSATPITVTPLSSDTSPWQTSSTGFGITGLGPLTKPATMSIKYTGVNVQNPSADTLGVAMQDGSGAWWYFGNPSWDGTSLVVTLDPAVFSALPAAALRIAAGAASASKLDATSLWVYERIYIKGKSDLFVKDFDDYTAAACNPQALKTGNADLLQFTDGTCQNLERLLGEVNWAVNGSPTGNAAVGTLDDRCSGTLGGVCNAQYSAPAKVPSSNPVTITALYTVTNTQVPAMKQVNIHGFGKYSVQATFRSATYPVCAEAPPTTYSDSLSFTLEALPPTDFFNVSQIHDNASSFSGPLPPVPDWSVQVRVSPETFLTTENVTATLTQSNPQTVEVTMSGTARSATCLFVDSSGLLVLQEQSIPAQADPVTFRFDPDPKQFDSNLKQTVRISSGPGGWEFVVQEIF